MGIHFNSPVTPGDSHPMPGGVSFAVAGFNDSEASSCRGKRKESKDDDEDLERLEEGHALPPPLGESHPDSHMFDEY